MLKRGSLQNRWLAAVAVLAIGAASVLASSAPALVATAQSSGNEIPPSNEWPTYGHDPGGMRFSPLTQITPANVGRLAVAWVYHMKPASSAGQEAGAVGRGRGGAGFSSSEVTPLVVNGTMYLSTPYSRVVAVDPTTGKEVWAFQLPSGGPSTRGVEYWPGDARTLAADRLRLERRQAVLAGREDREAERGVRRARAW